MCRFAAVLFATLAALPIAACGDSAEAKAARKEIQEAIDATRQLVIRSLEDVQRRAAPQLEQLSAGVEELRQELAQRGAAVSEDARAAVESARQRLQEAQRRLEAARQAGGEAGAQSWESLQDSVRQAGAAVEAAWRAVRQPDGAADQREPPPDRDK